MSSFCGDDISRFSVGCFRSKVFEAEIQSRKPKFVKAVYVFLLVYSFHLEVLIGVCLEHFQISFLFFGEKRCFKRKCQLLVMPRSDLAEMKTTGP